MGELMRRFQMIAAQPHKATANGGSILIAEPKIERLAVTFAPVQSGSGTPSPTNVRPISGWSAIPVSIGSQSESISLGGTYYGGTVDLVSGVLTVTHGCYSFDGSENWKAYNSISENTYRYSVALSSLPVILSKPYITGGSSHFVLANNINGPYGEASGNSHFQPKDPYGEHWGSTEAFVTWVAEQKTAGAPVQIYGQLATPQTYQLTPQTINALRGMQTVSSSAGSVTVTYYTNAGTGTSTIGVVSDV